MWVTHKHSDIHSKHRADSASQAYNMLHILYFTMSINSKSHEKINITTDYNVYLFTKTKHIIYSQIVQSLFSF